MFKISSLVLALVFASLAIAQGPSQGPSNDPSKTFEGQGQMVTLRVEMQDATAKLYIVGKKVADLDAALKPMIVKVTAKNDKGNVEELRFTPGQGYTVVEKLPDFQPPYTLIIGTSLKGKKEKISVKVKPVL